jgi:hypothetical protein
MLNIQNITENNVREFKSQELFDLSWDLSENKSTDIQKIQKIVDAELERRINIWENT